jgi:peptidoglycan/xylan/chitin deacetylase (PgdA/CDA1 family)
MRLSQPAESFVHPPKLMRRVVQTLQKAMYWTGGAAAYVRSKGVNGAIILLYHSVPDTSVSGWIDPANSMPAEHFKAQMRFLSRRRNVISMKELVDSIATSRKLEPGTVVITFDDGYRDNLEVAAPILERYRLPATLYLATRAMEQGRLWIDELYAMFCHRSRHELTVGDQRVDLADHAARLAAYRSLADALSRSDLDSRRDLLIKIEEQLCSTASGPRVMLNWNELRDLTSRFSNIEIGVHTSDHLDLAANESAAHEQIEQSMIDVERELKLKPHHFSFPYGRFTPGSEDVVRRLGLQSAAVAGANCLIGLESNPLALARIVAPQSISLLGFWTSGAYPGLSSALLGRA